MDRDIYLALFLQVAVNGTCFGVNGFHKTEGLEEEVGGDAEEGLEEEVGGDAQKGLKEEVSGYAEEELEEKVGGDAEEGLEEEVGGDTEEGLEVGNGTCKLKEPASDLEEGLKGGGGCVQDGKGLEGVEELGVVEKMVLTKKLRAEEEELDGSEVEVERSECSHDPACLR